MSRISICVFAVFAIIADASGAEIIGHWRMEQDTDAGTGFSIPNEVTGNPITGAAGSVEALNGGGFGFFPNLPNGAVPNASGLNGSPNINGTVAHYAALDATSITVEFFARANEGDARMLLRQTGSTGLRVDQPNDVRVQYSTASGQVTLDSNLNMDADWNHFAFTYDETTGLGQVFIDGALADSNDGPDGEGLTWPALSDLLVGNGMDGGGPFSGNTDAFFDELRIVDAAIDPSQFLIGDTALAIPEPASIAIWTLVGLGLFGFGYRRCRTSRK